MVDKFTENKMNETVTQLVFNWINLGYRREQIVRMIVAQGYGHKYAVRITDDAFSQLAEQYNDDDWV